MSGPPPGPGARLDQLCVDTIRTLSMDAVQAARSGHPGTPMALAPVAYCLWQRFLRYDPDDAAWPNRDRFVLSNGHASMLLYSLLHLAGVRALDAGGRPTGDPAVSLEDIRHFRRLGSRCPGHPEHGLTTGVEATTGPLGQGVGMSVGLALAARWLSARYDRPGFELHDHDVYALCSDGDLMEGVSGEAASLAGHQRLPNLCWIYDDNHITIEGDTALAFDEDVATRFLGYGWNVVRVRDANDLAEIDGALQVFRRTLDRPTLVIVRSHIAWGAPHKQDTAAAHGEPLGEDEVRLAKRAYGWPEDARFLVPPEVPARFQDGVWARGRALHQAWRARREEYRRAHPGPSEELDRIERGELPAGWDRGLPTFAPDPKGLATRASSGKALGALAKSVPWLLGGAGDLGPSTATRLGFEEAGDLEPDDPGGRNLHYGIREHAMAAATNGLALGRLRPFAATFFVFSDYLRPALRLGAMMRLPVIHVFTHDSIGLGEDGPTHQPVEHLASLRAMPGLVTIRPADANEAVEAWRVALRLAEPVALVLTRQAVPTLDRARYAPAAGLARGGYVLADCEGTPEVLLLGTGSEVGLCLEAAERLGRDGVRARVVSLPSWELFERQERSYQEAVLPPSVLARVAVEQASPLGWERWVGREGAVVGMRSFGASAPAAELRRHFGFDPEHVVAAARDQLARAARRPGA